ncbi:Integrase catalytic domain-containing protein [Mycena sanguinolenta]|uniref:Integrase catalytic domain-containing protein n=1 Tax=Mycena sanguinolenta TaxID=230812 RepID=A0A8H7DKW8_9AGAR|nr:Integrase catalytic domain-containing protein [Mycena sanguinolenta]
MANLQNNAVNNEKEWKGIKLTPIKEEEDGSNNYSEFKQKSVLDLDAAGYWQYVDGPDYNPPAIPELRPSQQVQGLDNTGASITITVPGNENLVAAAKKQAETWLAADKKAHAIIVKAVPFEKLYVVCDCQSAHDAWVALKNEYEPANALTAVTIKQQIIAYQCGTHENPVHWRQVMVQLYQKLRDADPTMMPDTEFAKHLVTLMTQSDDWRYCRDSLREKVRQGEMMGKPVSSAMVLQRLKHEEVEKKIAPSIVSINALTAGKGKTRDRDQGDAVPSAYGAESSNQANRRTDKAHQRQGKRSTPYNTQQRSAPRIICENSYCETPVGHTQANCFSYRGGKAGKYPENFRGRHDVHLAPEARIAARRKQALEGSGNRFAGLADHTEDTEEEVNAVIGKVEDGFAFMLSLPDDDDDEVDINKEIRVHAIVCGLSTEQDDTINHDTGASRHIFHKLESFHDYTAFESPLVVHGFGTSLTTQAVGKGKVVLKSTYDGTTRNFSLSNVLHIPTARCNLISGSRLDRKGVNTQTGNGKITYFNAANIPFATGTIVRDLYKMDVETVETVMLSERGETDLITAMVPSVTTLFGPGTENAEMQKQGFTTVYVHIKNCRICALANIKRSKFPRKANNRADRPLFRIHCDICGPLPAGYGGFKYFITFNDDCHRYIAIYFLKLKSDALKCFHDFRTAAEKFLGYPIIFLRVDNAPELVHGQFSDYCKEHGITYEHTIPDASQQNGVAERVNQIIERMTRAMLVDSSLSSWFWPLAAQAAVHIKNRVPHASLESGMTPFEGWFKCKPDLSHLRPFGALVTARKTNSDELMKLVPRGEEGRFVGRDVEFHGFPDFLPSPPLSDILWDDIPVDLEPRFRDTGDRIILEQSSNPASERNIAIEHNPASERNESSTGTNTSTESNARHRADELDDVEMEDVAIDDRPIAQRRTPRVRRVPARLIINHVRMSDEGGEDYLLSILESDNDELEIECENGDFASLAKCFIEAEAEFASAALTDPIDDPNARDPRTIQEAKSSIYWAFWLAAIHEELESLKAKGVYDEVSELPPGRKAVESKWVLHIKRDREGLISRFKARLVAKGFTQIPGQDFNYTFAPVARWESIRFVLALVADHDMVLRQIDVKTAFLNGPLDEEIYMRKPSIIGEGFWRLLKGLYGLKQAGRQWYLELNSRLEAIGFRRTESDWSVYRRVQGAEHSIVTTSVDDMLIASSSIAESDAVVAALASQFEITDNGEPKFHLGCSIERDRANRTLRIDQKSYTESILRDFGYENCNAVATPMDPGSRLSPAMAEDAEKSKDFPYTALVGKCMYLATCSRPDIAYTVRELARFMTSYGRAHVAAAKHLLRYLRGTTSHGITLGGTETLHPLFKALTDSDWGMGDTRKSVSGFLIMMEATFNEIHARLSAIPGLCDAMGMEEAMQFMRLAARLKDSILAAQPPSHPSEKPPEEIPDNIRSFLGSAVDLPEEYIEKWNIRE